MWLCLLYTVESKELGKPLALQKGLLPNIWVILFFSTDTIISDYPFCCTGGFVLFAEFCFFNYLGQGLANNEPADAGQILPACFLYSPQAKLGFYIFKRL